MTDIGTFGGSQSTAVAVNRSGQVIGNAYTAGDAASHAFLYSAGKLIDLGTLGGTNSSVLGINSQGQVIGTSDVAGSKVRRSFLYSDGIMQDLSSLFPGLSNFVATGINDAQQIVGSALSKTGFMRGLIVTAVPETDGWLLAATGFGAICLLNRYRRRKA